MLKIFLVIAVHKKKAAQKKKGETIQSYAKMNDQYSLLGSLQEPTKNHKF